MIRYVLYKLMLIVPTLFVLSMIIFMLMRAVPGDPAILLVGDLADPQALEEAR